MTFYKYIFFVIRQDIVRPQGLQIQTEKSNPSPSMNSSLTGAHLQQACHKDLL